MEKVEVSKKLIWVDVEMKICLNFQMMDVEEKVLRTLSLSKAGVSKLFQVKTD